MLPFMIVDSAHAEVPDWVKSSAGWWAAGEITDTDFAESIGFLIEEGIMQVAATGTAGQADSEIPDWVRNNAGWWASGDITENDFIGGIEYLVDTGVIHVDTGLADGVVIIVEESEFQKNADAPVKEEWMRHAPAGDKIDYPGVAIDTFRDAIHVTYGSTVGGSSNVMIQTSYDMGLTWEDPVRVNTDEGVADMPHANPPYIEMGPDGELYVLYNVGYDGPEWVERGFSFGYTALFLTRSDDGGKTFTPAMMVEPETGPGGQVGALHSKTFDSMFVADDGRVYVTWLDSRGKQNDSFLPTEVKIAWSDDGGASFEKSRTIKTKACQCCVTSGSTGTDGEVFVQYRNIVGNFGEPNIRDVVVSRSNDYGQTWNTPILVADDGFEIDNCPHSTSTISTDSAGNLHSAWWTQGGQSPGTYYAVSSDGGETWTDPLFLHGDGEWYPATTIKISMDADDNPVIFWADKTVEGGAVKYTQIVDGKSTGIVDLGTGDHPWSDSRDGITALVWVSDGKIMMKSWHDGA
ncbi:signal peptide protein [Cenarchaeum symbiosum A]|uniref:Signal peptide protein n=1 Tax=Cenarchaeum symbiosum (strain A) TaxID=414004 RepID=A0RTN2_CENSY|nr:signal peptide protein [Cenarchaeum symbiosum A]